MKKFESKLKSEEMDFLFNAILSLENLEECYRFFEDICTIGELQAMSQRLQVAKMLLEKRHIQILQKLQVQVRQQ